MFIHILNYHIRRYLFLKRSTFSQIREGIDKVDFLFSKILQLFIKRATEGLFDYYGMANKEEKQKRRSSKCVLSHNFLT